MTASPRPPTASLPRPAAAGRSRRAEETRDRILDAAARLLAERGWAGTTVEGIAAAAGVSKALIYHHFRGKRAILDAVVERTIAQWDAACRAEGWPGDGDALAALAALQRSGIRYARENPLLRALFQLDPRILVGLTRSAPLRRAVARLREQLVDVLHTGVERGQLRADLDVNRTADVVGLLHMALLDHLFEDVWSPGFEDGLVDASLDLVFRGIAAGRSS